MFARAEDLVQLTGDNGRRCEEFVRDLIAIEAYGHGIPPQQIQWDHRTNRADGGRDIIVTAQHSDESPRFVPQKPSIWSVKSGKDGIEPSTLRRELIAPNHRAVIDHLQNGNPFVWCVLQPLDEDGRIALLDKVKEVATTESFFDHKLVEVRTATQLCEILNDHPGLIAKHLLHLRDQLDGAMTCSEWDELDRFAVDWVPIDGRDVFVETIRQHLNGSDAANVLHIAGLSGIGKSRIVRQACNTEILNSVFYFPRFEAFSELFFRRLTRNENVTAQIVIDEVPLSDLESFKSKVGRYSQRLRFVTIGPIQADGQSRPSSKIHVLAPPGTQTGVLAVVRHAAFGLSDAVVDSVAKFSAHDLRLALMLLEATKSDGRFRDLPIQDGEDVWKRVILLFQDSIGDTPAFRTNYGYLTVCIDLGRAAEHRTELEHLAKEFDVSPVRLDEAITAAHKCGLGIVTERFFEAIPRALAGHIFRERIWPTISPRANDFIRDLPDRMLRRFVERCQECVGDGRQEMEVVLQRFFTVALGHNDIARLADRERSRIFKAWAEFDPKGGLGWLHSAVMNASEEQLQKFDGNNDGSGGWRGRRQIVWLCEELACFKEFFWVCEAILFRLAQVETEGSIANNSTHVWQELFWPILANTEIPFPERAQRLLERLNRSTVETLPLILSAAIGALKPITGRLAPPLVVGGRLVPESWQPPTLRVMREMQADVATSVLNAVSEFDENRYRVSVEILISEMRVVLAFSTVDQVRATIIPAIDADLKQRLRLKLDELISSVPGQGELSGKASNKLDELRQWYVDLAPTDLMDRIKDLTARGYWDVMFQRQRNQGI